MAENESQKKAVITKKKYRGEVFIKWEMCKGCGFCVEFCPSKVLSLSPNFNSKGYHPPMVQEIDRCTGCNLCGSFCPDFAIFARRNKLNENSEEGKE